MSIIQADYIVPNINASSGLTTQYINVAGNLTDSKALTFSGAQTATATANITVSNNLCHVFANIDTGTVVATATTPMVTATTADLADYAPSLAFTAPCYALDGTTPGIAAVTISTAGALSVQAITDMTAPTWAGDAKCAFCLNLTYPLAAPSE